MWVWEDEEKRIDDIGVRALLNQIDMFEKRLKNNNWPGIWSGETQAAQIIDILVKAGADTTQAKDRLRVAVADNAEELRRNQASWATDREADYDHFRNPVDDDSDQDDVDDNRTEQEFLDDQANILALMERKEKIKVHYLEFLIRYLDGLASPTKDVSQ
jgi:hypothetical protein